MKKAAYLFGVLGLILYATTLFFSAFHMPGESALLFFGTLFNEIITLPVIAISIIKANGKNNSVKLMFVISLFLFIGGLCCKIQHWPGSFASSIAGLILFCVSATLYGISLYKQGVGKGGE